MTSDGASLGRLREYLQTLSPEARSMLVTELERGLLRRDDIAGGELVLQELRRTIRAYGQPVPRIGNTARRFFMPLEPFLIDGPADHKRIGRLARASLAPIWNWMSRDLMPAEVRALSEDIDYALVTEDHLKAEQSVRVLHDTAIQRVSAAMAALGADEKAQRQFCLQLGAPRAVEDLKTLVRILGIRDVLAEVARQLPDHYRAFERRHADPVRVLFDSAFARNPLQRASAQKSDLLLYGLILVVNRMAARWQLIRVATRAADSDDTARIAATPYAVAVDIALCELEHKVSELRLELKAGRPVTSLLKAIYDAARAMRTEMDLSVASAYSRQLAAIRSAVSNLLTPEIETTPGRVRRLLRPRSADEIVHGSLLDPMDVHDVESRVELAALCRHYADELAISEVTQRACSELTQYVEADTRILLESFASADDAERAFRRSQLDVAVRFCGTLFGADYAGVMANAAEAVQGAVTNRWVMHA
jgi:hypothetical protein